MDKSYFRAQGHSNRIGRRDSGDCIDSDGGKCAICLNDIEHVALGPCSHAICYICSTRLRLLSKNKECPICREHIVEVVFSSRTKSDDSGRRSGKGAYNKRAAIKFLDSASEAAFQRLIAFACSECRKSGAEGGDFDSMASLDRHVRRDHDLHFCQICVEHLLLFPSERRLYSRSALANHLVKGDADESSQRGHPLCSFCKLRFLDADQLFVHSRKEHFFCHFCDTDGVHIYFPTYAVLRDHFKRDHFLCLDGACADEQFTHAFRTELDLRAHQLERHMTRAEAKQGRNISIIVSKQNCDRAPVQEQSDLPHGEPSAPISYDDAFPSIGETQRQPHSVPTSSSSGTVSCRQFGTLSLDDAETDRLAEMQLHRTEVEATTASGSRDANSTRSATQQTSAQRMALSVGQNVRHSWAARPLMTKSRAELMDEEFPSLPGACSRSKLKSSKVGNSASRIESATASGTSFSHSAVMRRPVSETNKNTPQNGPSVIATEFPALPVTAKNRTAIAKNRPSSAQSVSKVPNGLPVAVADQFPSLPSSRSRENSSTAHAKGHQWPVATIGQRKMVPSSAKPVVVSNCKPRPVVSSRYNFDQPLDFKDRSKKLMATVKSVLQEVQQDSDESGASVSDKLSDFKVASHSFKSGQMEANTYYDACLSICGKSTKRLGKFFGELLVLLPDIDKQTELAAVHEKVMLSTNSNGSNKNKNTLPNVVRCDTCRQFVHCKDHLMHLAKH